MSGPTEITEMRLWVVQGALELMRELIAVMVPVALAVGVAGWQGWAAVHLVHADEGVGRLESVAVCLETRVRASSWVKVESCTRDNATRLWIVFDETTSGQ